MNATVKTHLENSKNFLANEQESFDRCDTDGFLSQWASRMNSGLEIAEAFIAHNGGVHPFPCLMDGDRVVEAEMVSVYNKYSYSYDIQFQLSFKEAVKYGRSRVPFISKKGGSSRVQKKLGLTQGVEFAKAEAEHSSPPGSASKGTGGCMNVRVRIVRADGLAAWDWGYECSDSYDNFLKKVNAMRLTTP